MSKRHHANRRKTYGRRQHEVYERRGRERRPEAFEAAYEDVTPGGLADRFSFLDPRTPRLRFAAGD